MAGSTLSVTTVNGAAASSPLMRAMALRVISSSTSGTSTTTNPRAGVEPRTARRRHLGNGDAPRRAPPRPA